MVRKVFKSNLVSSWYLAGNPTRRENKEQIKNGKYTVRLTVIFQERKNTCLEKHYFHLFWVRKGLWKSKNHCILDFQKLLFERQSSATATTVITDFLLSHCNVEITWLQTGGNYSSFVSAAFTTMQKIWYEAQKHSLQSGSYEFIKQSTWRKVYFERRVSIHLSTRNKNPKYFCFTWCVFHDIRSTALNKRQKLYRTVLLPHHLWYTFHVLPWATCSFSSGPPSCLHPSDEEKRLN